MNELTEAYFNKTHRSLDAETLFGMNLFIHVMKLEADHPLRIEMTPAIETLMNEVGQHLPQKYQDAWSKGETI